MLMRTQSGRTLACKPARRVAVVALASLLVAGCAWWRPAPAPLVTEVFAVGNRGESAYALLLPGRGDRPSDFQRAGFPQALVDAGFPGEIVGADAHLRYYLKRTAIPRLREDVIVPRYPRKPWIVGVSMGGLGALLYEKEHPDTAAGLVLLAPFVGDRKLVREIKAAGGLASWEPGAIGPDDWQRELWAWIKDGGLARVPVYLAWGASDRFAEGDALLASMLPAERVVEIPGGHTWWTWKPAFLELLQRGACGVTPAES